MVEQIQVASDSPDMTAEEAHNQEMLEKVDEVEHNIDGVTPSQEDKFGGDYAKLKKSYEELERKFHTPEETVPEEPQLDDLSIPKNPEAPFDMGALQQEYLETGELSENSYKVLENAGISKEYTDRYIAGMEALGKQMGNNVMESVGGRDQYASMVEWAKSNYTPEQIQSYDKAVNSGDINQATLAAKGLMADYQGSTGVEGTTYGGESASNMGDENVFRSNAEVVAAMKDPKYETDLAYRQDVLEKLDRSEIFISGTV
tara:strand:+ start:1298 stop:2074 length:777 start_codon:yes stop_codon:yes gene_type:complete